MKHLQQKIHTPETEKMVNHGCKADGSLNESKFDEPMPWIGMYVAAAALACAIAMTIDALHGFRYKKLWLPCKFFSLNATTLALIAVAIKFSMDLNATMPHRQDQLAKVSSSAFICTVMANFMPSLAAMENTDLLINIVALGILVLTAIANICIQIGTGVIFAFWVEHGCILLLMFILLAIACSLSVAIPTTKHYLDIKYSQKLKLANKERSTNKSLSVADGVREDLRKYWLLAYSSGPQFVIGLSAPCTASGALCLINTLILAEAILRSYLIPSSIKFCKGESDYKWSTTIVLVSQTIAVAIGTIAPTVRCFMAINFNCLKKAKQARNNVLGVDKYWIKKLILWQHQPLDLNLCGHHHGRKLARRLKHQTVGLLIGLQKGIVLSCQIIRFVSILLVGWFLDLKRSVTGEKIPEDNPHTNLNRFIVHLDGEEELVNLMMKNNGDSTAHWIKIGEKQKPKNLIQLLKKFDTLLPFKGVREFDNDQVPSLGFAEPPNCWALPIVTLTSIALALPFIDRELIKQLVSSVHEGLKYVREIEDNLDENKDLKNVRIAEEIVWSGVELDGIWLDVNLCEMALKKGKGMKETIKALSDISKEKFMEYGEIHLLHMKEWYLEEDPSRWCIRMLAANSMYRICESILMEPDIQQYDQSSERLFEKLSLKICTLFSACFTNLKHVISGKCRESKIEEREQNIRYAVLLFGKTEEIIRIIDMKKVQDSSPGQLVHIDDWHLLCKQADSVSSISPSTDKESAICGLSSLYISIAQ